jgi:allophanate hydrolase subunit 2
MKTVAVENLARSIGSLMKSAPREVILLTKNGRPFAFMSDASQYDWEDIGYITDPAFWKMIAQRRKEKTIPFEQINTELAQREKNTARRKGAVKHRLRNGRNAA